MSLPYVGNCGVGRAKAGRLLTAERTGCDHRRLRTVGIMHVPFVARQHGGVLIAGFGLRVGADQRQSERGDDSGRARQDEEPLVCFHIKMEFALRDCYQSWAIVASERNGTRRT